MPPAIAPTKVDSSGEIDRVQAASSQQAGNSFGRL
jgi:hypothetical protein